MWVQGIIQGSLLLFSVFFKAFLYFVAVTLIWLFGSSTDIDCDCQNPIHKVKFRKIFYTYFPSTASLSHLMTICLFSYSKTPLIYMSATAV